MKQKMVFGVLTFLLILQAQAVFAERWNKQEIDFLIALERSDLAAMEKALQESTRHQKKVTQKREPMRKRKAVT